MFKKIGAVLLTALLCTSLCVSPALAEVSVPPENGEIYFNGLDLKATTFRQYGECCLPIRTLFEAMGYKVTWSRDGNGEQITVSVPGGGVQDVKTFDVTTPRYYDNGRLLPEDIYLFTDLSDGRYYISPDLACELFPLSVRIDGNRVLVDTIAQSGAKIEPQSLENNAAYLTQTASYPAVLGLDGANAQSAINEAFEAAAKTSFQTGQNNEAELSAHRKSGVSFPNTASKLSYHAKYNQNGLLSVDLVDEQYVGGATHSILTQTGMTFDLSSGKKLVLADLMADWPGAKKAINAWIEACIPPHSTVESFTSIADDQSYTLTNSGVSIQFQQYEYFPGSYGLVSMNVPYSELKVYLKPAYSFLSNLPVTLDSTRANELTAGQTANLVLAANATTGYNWHLTSSDPKVVSAIADYYVTDQTDTGLAGRAAVGDVFVLQAVGKGVATVTMRYYRDWEGAESTSQTATYQITVK